MKASVELDQGATQEPVASRRAGGLEVIVDHEERDHGARIADRLGESRVVVDAQVAAEPDHCGVPAGLTGVSHRT